MRKKIIAEIICLGLCLGSLPGITNISYALESEQKAAIQESEMDQKTGAEALEMEAAAVKDLYRMDNEGDYSVFSNYVHGYSLFVDQGMQIDMSYSGILAVLENDQKRIEIYKDVLPDNISQEAYINYSNKFISNTVDHTKEFETRTAVSGKSVHILQWSRQKLSGIENDKNYYASIEILSGTREVYTIFVKSTDPLNMNGGYDYLINNFNIFTPTKDAYMRQANPIPTEERGWNKETLDFYNDFFGPDSTLKWGLFQPKAPDDFNQMNYLEKEMDYTFPILLNYTNINNTYKHPDLEYRLQNTYKHNKTLELTLQTIPAGNGESNMVYSVLDGDYDEFLKNYAKTISDFKHPVLFRLGNEMNGDWCPYSGYNTSKDTEIFKAFYRYIYKIFEDAGADNVIWIWNPNGKSFPDFQWNHELMYYPGDEYVDIVGLTAYNTGTYYPDEKWIEFADLYDTLYAEYTNRYRHPMMITEFASSSVGGDKNQWIKNMFEHIDSYPEIKAAVWWDGCDWDADGNVARPYFIDETLEIIQTFKEMLNKKPRFWDVYA